MALDTPILPEARFREIGKFWAKYLLPSDWRVFFHFHKPGQLSRRYARKVDIEGTYCAAIAQPQYLRLTLWVNLYSDGWSLEVDINETLRHELGHALVSVYTHTVNDFINDNKKLLALDRAEDVVVEWYARLPIHRLVTPPIAVDEWESIRSSIVTKY